MHGYPRLFPFRFAASRFSYMPGASQARQFVSSVPEDDFIPSTPVCQSTEKSTVEPMTPPVQGTCEGAPVRTLRYLWRNSAVYAPRCP
eukprot:CAMPEP_0181186700 /NCGR_PEP_ID=MMETSP1096-20121128/10172_1 /TAXON_ID=156174 ORGANISM="Chrysochromulina ericina, Strain CCMP281" /NCGR_SAMPLE_ID=MMETSP1096 /ASSEMBLY_ACC=CAM_ASM_000453 /LENGTH=87 /DNA_ID=CAMNT_0023275611 /DNA_START=76 /DNA_END=339 /DNA_ORIENTATION=-